MPISRYKLGEICVCLRCILRAASTNIAPILRTSPHLIILSVEIALIFQKLGRGLSFNLADGIKTYLFQYNFWQEFKGFEANEVKEPLTITITSLLPLIRE